MNKDTDPENIPQEEISIGDLLRTEREKKGISKSRLAEDIKVREHVIDAIENEEWDKLPARVFIKGFIRSYTISIGYDTKKALRLFDKNAPSRGEDSPVPLTGGRKKSRVMFYAVPILIILAVAVYLFTARDKVENGIETSQAVSETSPQPAEAGTDAGLTEQGESVETAIPDETGEELNVKETTPSVPEKKVIAREEPSRTSEERVKKEERPEIIKDENTQAEEPVETVQEKESTPVEEPLEYFYEEEETPPSETVSEELSGPVMTLSANIIMRTYVKIIVDDNPPKEFIFQPGANPDWTAERGFEITVGNAAGIEFVFNGEIFKDIGRMGRVKTLRFPEDFKTNWEEE